VSSGTRLQVGPRQVLRERRAENFVDLRFIKELDDSGYIDKLYKK